MLVDRLRDRFGVEPCLRVLQIPPSTYDGWLVERHKSRRRRTLEDEWEKLAGRVVGDDASAQERDAYNRAGSATSSHAGRAGAGDADPSGNVLRAAESRPADKYGLDAVKCWPHCGWCCPMRPGRNSLPRGRAWTLRWPPACGGCHSWSGASGRCGWSGGAGRRARRPILLSA
jgi:hypothetical protein